MAKDEQFREFSRRACARRPRRSRVRPATARRACGAPGVAAQTPGIEDVLDGGEEGRGVLVPAGRPSDLASALIRLLGDPELAERFGRRARVRVEERFAPDRVGAALKAFLLEGNAGSAHA
jgi:glycosyltransferase involved in cell wall biosynthesis